MVFQRYRYNDMSNSAKKPYKLIGAYDSETTNIIESGRGKLAFPILHQLGIFNKDIQDITPATVENDVKIFTYRHCLDLYRHLDAIIAQDLDFIPVIACHNLSFDMYGLSTWLNRHDVKVLAKSPRKPITFTVDNALVIWDTLIFTQKPLDYMGRECGYEKLTGAWDYDKIRTPETELTNNELAYAMHDIYALIAYLGYWCRVNPDISPADLGRNVVTKTGVVRARRLQRLGKIKGKGLKKTVGKYWIMQNKNNMPKSNDELFTVHACTRGGFTFVSSRNASIPYDLGNGYHVYGYDATSQHPAQIVSHRYPDKFRLATIEELAIIADIICNTTIEDILKRFDKPFTVAICACYEFTNLRRKKDSIFTKWGIYPLASARCKEYTYNDFAEDNMQTAQFREFISHAGYKDKTVNGSFLFGKLISADKARLYVTELALWEIAQFYEWDSLKPVHGYMTMRFARPSDMAVLSVMNFYDAKNQYKQARERYYSGKPINNAQELLDLGLPAFVVEGMQDGSITSNIVDSTYLGLKADLNALFGIEACNEYRRDTVLDECGISYSGEFGIKNAPRIPKAWYQMGQRIVGWSRIAQILVMYLLSPCIETVINGDTDSIKVVAHESRLSEIEKQLNIYACAVDQAKHKVTARARRAYPDQYNDLRGIGHYVHEFTTDRFCASWNKAYCIADDKKARFTLAGIPTRREGVNIDALASQYMQDHSFDEMCNIFLGYNVTYTYDLIRLHARKFPEWGEMVFCDVTDYTGKRARVAETAALCLYPMAKTVNDTGNAENAENMKQAIKNNSDVNTDPCLITASGYIDMREVIGND